MTEGAIKSNSNEAQRLYQRGIAAARGGHKRVAAGLLSRSIRLDPHNELAWLWLSGVLEDPQQIAFCLQSVLKLNPNNQRAQQGLRWLEERNLLKGPPATSVDLPTLGEESADARVARTEGESWWVNWRQSRRDMRRVRLLLWSVPIVAVSLALLFYISVTTTLQASEAEPTPVVMAAAEVVAPPPAPPILEAEPISLRQSMTVGYLNAFAPLRARLREATDAFRNIAVTPGNASVRHVSATQSFRETVAGALAEMDSLRPPLNLQQAHNDYREGLALELEGLDALLEYYASFNVEHANRAAIRFQQAEAYFDRARAVFTAQNQQIEQVSAISSFTPR
jgi:tetratricopeptide (TPR) repeat protein